LSELDNALWCPNPLPDAAARLVCFPHAGGGPTTFRAWPAELAPTIEVATVTLPGRASRVAEPFATSLADAVGDIGERIERAGDDRPLALFGHSLGAILAYEVAHDLVRRGRSRPVHLFVAGSRAPDDRDGDRLEVTDDDAVLVEEVESRYGAIPAAVRSEPDLLAMFLPVLRSDLRLLTEYQWNPRPPLGIPITAFAGVADRAGPPQSAPRWSAHTDAEFRDVRLPGDHFFVHSQLQQVSAIVRQALDVG
jgi:surfactin synthase thioesterase subunit